MTSPRQTAAPMHEPLPSTRRDIARYLMTADPTVAAAAIEKLMDENAELRRRPVDPMHPCGKCTCSGEGSCAWCTRSADALPDYSAPADLAEIARLTAEIARLKVQRCEHDNCRKPLEQHEGHRWCNVVDLAPQEFLAAPSVEHEDDADDRPAPNPVGRCPRCGSDWYATEGFCGGCHDR